MNNAISSPQTDIWRDWLLHIRHGNDAESERILLGELRGHADRVLDGAQLASGMTLVDVGSGDGLIAFNAIDRVGPSLKVILADISGPLLEHTEALALTRNVRAQCDFVRCSAESLDGIGNETADAVTTRAVLAYVSNKPAAMREFHRILKPQGRISISEPILRDDAVEAISLRMLVDTLPKEDTDNFFRLLHRWKSAMFPDDEEKLSASPLTNFIERDLARFALDAGFRNVHLEFHIDVRPASCQSWDVLLDSSPHPWSPTLGDVLAHQFTAAERSIFEKVLRPELEKGALMTAERVAYLTARKASTWR